MALLTTNTSSSLHSSRTNYRIIMSTLFGISNYIFDWILLLHGTRTTAPSIRSVEQSGFPLVLCGRLSVSLDSLSAMATIFGEKQTLHGPLKFRTLIEPAIRCILCTPPANVKYTNPQTHSHHHLHRTHSTANLFMAIKLPLVIARRPNSFRLLATPHSFLPCKMHKCMLEWDVANKSEVGFSGCVIQHEMISRALVV